MGFTKPSDLALMVFLFVLVLFVMSLGVASIQNSLGVESDTKLNESFTQIAISVDNITGVRAAGSKALVGETGGGDQVTRDNLITRTYESLKGVTQSWNIAEDQTSQITSSFGIDPVVLTIGMAMLLIVFAVVTYSWIVGRT